MGKNDFDIDFDFEEEYGFDPKAFLGSEEYDDNIDLNAFSDEELGLTSQDEPENDEDTAAPADDTAFRDLDLGSGFSVDDDLDLDEFLNMGSEEETNEDEDPEEEEEDWAEEPDFSDEDEPEFEESEEYAEETEFEDEPDLPEDSEPEEIDMDETMDYTEDTEQMDETANDEDTLQEDSEQEKPIRKRQPKAPKLPKITLPKLKTPNIFTKFFDLYFAPVLYKDMREEPQDPNNPRRRRRKSKAQIFKEVYLPPIIACVCLILVLSFLIGSLSNAITLRQIEKSKEESQLAASVSAAELAEQEAQRILAEAEELAAGYDYKGATDKLDSIGDLSQYPDLVAKKTEYVNAQNQLVEYKDYSQIPNLSFHVLIEDMARATKDETYGGMCNRNFVTTGEFTKILNQLYSNGYILVDFDSFVEATTDVSGNAQFISKSLWLPADKKPVMITETMVNYFTYMIDGNGDGLADANGDGFASRLVVDGNGDIKAEYVDASGQTLTGNYDLVPILEDFIKEHPDFSYRGARATLAVTGDEGVFGYRCNTSYIATKGQAYYDNEAAGAKTITQALRDKGYTIACYTYANKAYKDMSVSQIQADLQSWTQQIVSVIGEVDTFVFAKTSNITDYSGNAFNVMYTSGFRYFISNSTSPLTEVNTTYVRQNRLMVTGNSMAWYPSQFTDRNLFDPNAVLDMTTRVSVPNG